MPRKWCEAFFIGDALLLSSTKRENVAELKIQVSLCIMRRLVNIIYSMMKKGTAYRSPEMKAEEEKEKMIFVGKSDSIREYKAFATFI